MATEPVEGTQEYIESILARRSQVFATVLGKLGYSGIAHAIANADLGVLGGPKVNPNLKPGAGSDHSTIRYAEGSYTYTMIHVQQVTCRKCGFVLEAEKHDFTVHHEERGIEVLGHVIVCHRCEPESPLFGFSRMPRALARKALEAKYVV